MYVNNIKQLQLQAASTLTHRAFARPINIVFKTTAFHNWWETAEESHNSPTSFRPSQSNWTSWSIRDVASNIERTWKRASLLKTLFLPRLTSGSDLSGPIRVGYAWVRMVVERIPPQTGGGRCFSHLSRIALPSSLTSLVGDKLGLERVLFGVGAAAAAGVSLELERAWAGNRRERIWGWSRG